MNIQNRGTLIGYTYKDRPDIKKIEDIIKRPIASISSGGYHYHFNIYEIEFLKTQFGDGLMSLIKEVYSYELIIGDYVKNIETKEIYKIYNIEEFNNKALYIWCNNISNLSDSRIKVSKNLVQLATEEEITAAEEKEKYYKYGIQWVEDNSPNYGAKSDFNYIITITNNKILIDKQEANIDYLKKVYQYFSRPADFKVSLDVDLAVIELFNTDDVNNQYDYATLSLNELESIIDNWESLQP